MQIKAVLLVIFALVFTACDLSKSSGEGTPLARVNDTFLMAEDIDFSEFEALNSDDSLVQIRTIVRNWATQQLLIDGATLNIEEQQQADFEALVQQYKTDLYTSAYLEALVKRNLDTTITQEELTATYNQNKELFVLKEDLLKLRYINIESNISNVKDIKRRFKRYNSEDQAILDTISIQFNSFFLNDSIWIKSDQVISKIKPLQKGFNELLLKKPNFIQLNDSLELYLIQIKEVLGPGMQAPLAYVLPTLRQIIINKRKLKLVGQLKNEIVNDAIKNKKFEIYE
ncbi:MAG: peptidyl-prolyl cis-trans isomerase [Flavobacteriaceae bacterium]